MASSASLMVTPLRLRAVTSRPSGKWRSILRTKGKQSGFFSTSLSSRVAGEVFSFLWGQPVSTILPDYPTAETPGGRRGRHGATARGGYRQQDKAPLTSSASGSQERSEYPSSPFLVPCQPRIPSPRPRTTPLEGGMHVRMTAGATHLGLPC